MIENVIPEIVKDDIVVVAKSDQADLSTVSGLDLVCSFPERGRRVSVEIARSIFVGSLALFAFWAGATAFVFAFSLFPELAVFLFAIPFILFCIGVWLNARFDCAFPSNIQCTKRGLSLAWRRTIEKTSNVIAWDSVIGASILNVGQKEVFPYLILDIDLTEYSYVDRLIMLFETMNLWREWFPCPARKSAPGVDVLSIAFPLQSLTLETDKMRLLSFVKEHVPAALLSDNLLTMTEAKGVPTYTQLWLDDMQSFRRSRTGALEPGTVLHDGQYEITGLLATGGQARIYRGKDSQSLVRELVVLKEFVLPTNAGAEVRNNSFASIKNEANFLSSLNHPGIVRLLDHFVEDHRAYLVLEFIEGETLRNLVKKGGPLPQGQVMDICRALCEICAYLHGQKPPVVHRDLTPDNLIWTSNGELRLIDFSVAQHFEADRTKTVSGKHNYMAPEQFRGTPTTQSDLYALGGTLYYLLTGEDPTPLSCSVVPAQFDVSENLRALISKLTRMEASDRFASALAVMQELPAEIETVG